MTDATLLRRLAEAATPGPWLVTRQKFVCLVSDVEYYVTTVDAGDRTICDAQTRPNDCAYIAAMHPQAALALLDRLARYKALVAQCKATLEAMHPATGMPNANVAQLHTTLVGVLGNDQEGDL